MNASSAVSSQPNLTLVHDSSNHMYVTMRVDKQLFGIDVEQVRDVLRQQHIMPIPLAPREVSGSLNLRGRIVTVVNVRQRLGLPERTPDAQDMFVVVEHKNELYSLMVDNVGEVMTIPNATMEKVPGNLNSSWKEVASGIHKLPDELLVIIDVQTILTLK